MVSITKMPEVVMSFTRSVGDGQSLVFQTHISPGTTEKDLNGTLDLLSRAAARQEALGKINNLRFDLVQMEQHRSLTATAMKDAMNRFERASGTAPRSGKGTQVLESLQASHVAEIKNFENELQHFDRNIEKRSLEIKEAEGLIHGHDSGTDRKPSHADR